MRSDKLKEEIKFFVIKIMILYVLLSFFPVVRLEFLINSSNNIIVEYIKFFFKNLIHLWYLKILGVIILSVASIRVKVDKENKYKNNRK